MTLEEICAEVALEVRSAADRMDVQVTGGYASDLLSCVMARAQSGFVWITLQAHPNIVAVASLLNLSGIIITESVTPDPDTLQKAEQQGIPVLTTPLTTFTVAGKLAALGVHGAD